MGGLLGAASGGAAVAALSGMVGTALSLAPMPLPTALKRVCQERGLRFAYWRHVSKVEIVCAFQDAAGVYWTINSKVTPKKDMTPTELADALYDGFVRQLTRWQQDHGASRSA